MNLDFVRYMDACRDRIDNLLASNLLGGTVTARADLREFAEACQYSLTNGGKRVRPLLVYASARACGYEDVDNCLDRIGCAVEIVHCYSLVHDDLPAMDDDDLRRGKPSLHKAYSEATAILVGDSLQAQAFEVITETEGLSAAQQVAMIQCLARSAGMHGMVGGQHIDIQATDSDLSLMDLQTMHSLKTGALIRAALALGGIAAGGSPDQLTALDKYGTHIGLAFQVVDDILDQEADTNLLGKTQGKDAEANKPTYVKLLGLEGAKVEAQKLLEAAIDALSYFGESADYLRELARYIVERNR